MLPHDFVEYIYQVGSSHDLRSIIKSGLIAGGRDAEKERHTVFFTAVDAMRAHLHVQREFDLTKHRFAICTQNGKVHRNSVYLVNVKLAQRQGMTFYQTRSNAIILYDTLPSFCNEEVVFIKSGEMLYDKVCESPRPVSTSTLKDDWQGERRHNAAAAAACSSSTKLSQPIQERISASNGRPVAFNEETILAELTSGPKDCHIRKWKSRQLNKNKRERTYSSGRKPS